MPERGTNDHLAIKARKCVILDRTWKPACKKTNQLQLLGVRAKNVVALKDAKVADYTGEQHALCELLKSEQYKLVTEAQAEALALLLLPPTTTAENDVAAPPTN